MDRDDHRLNNMIGASDVKLKDRDHWFSFKSQKVLKYNLAVQLLLAEDMTPEEAIQTSDEFHNLFYKMVMEYTPNG